MEEKKLKERTEKKETSSQKLTYEQLEAYANQTTMQAQKIYQENQALRQSLEEVRRNVSLKEIELAIKCLDHADLFSDTFITSITSKLEEILTPAEEPEQPTSKEE